MLPLLKYVDVIHLHLLVSVFYIFQVPLENTMAFNVNALHAQCLSAKTMLNVRVASKMLRVGNFLHGVLVWIGICSGIYTHTLVSMRSTWILLRATIVISGITLKQIIFYIDILKSIPGHLSLEI
jgi:hypothetical protein